jgi:hypothetical protein
VILSGWAPRNCRHQDTITDETCHCGRRN